ncbi:flagellar brake protein [Acidithiobacillus sp.]|uniref:flagellar brake protein n=1 Tax=Acidithiobacillus sp. TaxID=1872118 RepID=UPI003D038DDD
MSTLQETINRLFSDPYKLESASAVERALRQLVEGRELVTVILRHGAQPHTSMILALDGVDGAPIIDDLQPEADAGRTLAGMRLLLLGRVQGVYTGFQSEVQAHIVWNRYGALRLALPTTVFQLQRRAFLRAAPVPGESNRVTLQRRGARILDGLCEDIGGGGMRVRIGPPRDFPLYAGEKLAAVQFSLNGKALAVAGEVCSVGAMGRSGAEPRQVLGLRFLDLPEAVREQIIQHTLRCDRQHLRSTRGNLAGGV